MSNSILHLENVSKTYRQGDQDLEILRGIDLSLMPGEAVALLGPSGSGKSTLLHLAGLLERPSAGQIHFLGQDVSKYGDRKKTILRRKQIGFVYQFHHLLSDFTALENVMLPMILNGMKKPEAKKEAALILEKVGLVHRFGHRPHALSGGERQRVAIARALANNPPLLLADEPTGNLDHDTAASVMNLIQTIIREKNMAALIVTHNLELAQSLPRVMKLESGKIREGKAAA